MKLDLRLYEIILYSIARRDSLDYPLITYGKLFTVFINVLVNSF